MVFPTINGSAFSENRATSKLQAVNSGKKSRGPIRRNALPSYRSVPNTKHNIIMKCREVRTRDSEAVRHRPLPRSLSARIRLKTLVADLSLKKKGEEVVGERLCGQASKHSGASAASLAQPRVHDAAEVIPVKDMRLRRKYSMRFFNAAGSPDQESAMIASSAVLMPSSP